MEQPHLREAFQWTYLSRINGFWRRGTMSFQKLVTGDENCQILVKFILNSKYPPKEFNILNETVRSYC